MQNNPEHQAPDELAELHPIEVIHRAIENLLDEPLTPAQFIYNRRQMLGRSAELIASDAFLDMPLEDYLAVENGEAEVPTDKVETLRSALRCRNGDAYDHLFCNVMGTRFMPVENAKPKEPERLEGEWWNRPKQDTPEETIQKAVVGEYDITPGEFLELQFHVALDSNYSKLWHQTKIRKDGFDDMVKGTKPFPSDETTLTALKKAFKCTRKPLSDLFDRLLPCADRPIKKEASPAMHANLMDVIKQRFADADMNIKLMAAALQKHSIEDAESDGPNRYHLSAREQTDRYYDRKLAKYFNGAVVGVPYDLIRSFDALAEDLGIDQQPSFASLFDKQLTTIADMVWNKAVEKMSLKGEHEEALGLMLRACRLRLGITHQAKMGELLAIVSERPTPYKTVKDWEIGSKLPVGTKGNGELLLNTYAELLTAWEQTSGTSAHAAFMSGADPWLDSTKYTLLARAFESALEHKHNQQVYNIDAENGLDGIDVHQSVKALSQTLPKGLLSSCKLVSEQNIADLSLTKSKWQAHLAAEKGQSTQAGRA